MFEVHDGITVGHGWTGDHTVILAEACNIGPRVGDSHLKASASV